MNTHEKLLQRLRKEGECLVWTGTKDKDGYGVFRLNNRWHKAHRYFYPDDIPKGLLVLHSCDNPPCVLPDHLRVGTSQDNVDDMVKRGRSIHPSNPTAICRNGHIRTINNTYVSPNTGQRECKDCSKAAYKKRQLNKINK